jgi:histidine decarboxylase
LNRIILVLLGVIFLSNPASAITESQRERLDQFAQKFLEKKKSAAGYPVNQDTSLDEFYAWYMKHGMYLMAMNNVGDPYKQSPYSLNSHEFEQEVVNYFAKLYGFKEGDYWGFVTASGTDGNNHGIYFGRKYLKSKSPVEPIIYVSEEAHYSIKKLADVQNTELRLIKATTMGQMDMGDFEKQLDSQRPALVVIAMGTTFKGAMDDQAVIRKILQAKHRGPVYIHSDAAQLVHQQTQKFDSIVVSGHKFFGFDEPTGVFICTRETFKNLNPFDVPYLTGAVPTITTSRSALSPLKFWWKINSTSMEDFRAAAGNLMSNAEYLLKSLKKVGIRVWKNPYSNTLFFERPSVQVIKKFDLAPDESTQFGKIAHFVVMPHFDKKLIDSFVLDMKEWKGSLPAKNQR